MAHNIAPPLVRVVCKQGSLDKKAAAGRPSDSGAETTAPAAVVVYYKQAELPRWGGRCIQAVAGRQYREIYRLLSPVDSREVAERSVEAIAPSKLLLAQTRQTLDWIAPKPAQTELKWSK